MEGVISNYLSKKLLDHALGIASYTMPETIYVGLASDDATAAELAAGTLTNEITDYDDNRKAITMTAAALEDSQDALSDMISVSGGSAIEFADMPACTVAWVMLCDAATAGNVLFALPLVVLEAGEDYLDPDPKTVSAGDTFRLPVGQVIAFIGQRVAVA